jgi:hypothetical protein
MNRRLTITVKLGQEAVFSESCLPLTMELAKVFKTLVRTELPTTPPLWPFEDRVLLWLLPSLRKDIMQFHGGTGSSMTAIFQEHVLQSIDSSLLGLLVDRLEKRRPGTLESLSEVIKGATHVRISSASRAFAPRPSRRDKRQA